jgi:23S rRNA (uridine2552-2'-O)-methyltransferase
LTVALSAAAAVRSTRTAGRFFRRTARPRRAATLRHALRLALALSAALAPPLLRAVMVRTLVPWCRWLGVRDAFAGLAFAEDDEDLPDVLHGRRTGRRADETEQVIAFVAVRVENADLDQLMGREVAVDLLDDRLGEPIGADHHDRLEFVRARLESLAFRGIEVAYHRSFRLPAILLALGMKRTKSSRAWLHEHVTDPYVHRAKAEGYRSRAAFKLMEIDAKDRLLAPGQTVVDLGAAPGSWAQVALAKVGARGRVIGLDLLEIEPLPGAMFLRGDFLEESVEAELATALGGRRVDLVLSDMAPNMSGIASSDQARSIALAELAVEFSRRHLKPDGAFLVKTFQGAGFPELLASIRRVFRTVATRKPKASRDRSSEIYLVARGLRGAP